MTPVGRRRLFTAVFGLIGVTFVALALVDSWRSSRSLALPSVTAVSLALVAVSVGLFGAFYSWASLLDSDDLPHLRRAYYLGQLGKYAPGGGVWQAVGQIGLTAGPDLSIATISVAFGTHAIAQIAIGAFAGGFLVFAQDAPTWIRVAAAVGLAAPLLLIRAWMQPVVALAARITRRPMSRGELPDQKRIVKAFLWSAFPMVGSGLSFAILARSVGLEIGLLHATTAFALAWVLGFVAIPFPSGVGVREAVLFASIGGAAPLIVAASVFHRLLVIVAESGFALVARLRSP